jgi:hypothetical protein
VPTRTIGSVVGYITSPAASHMRRPPMQWLFGSRASSGDASVQNRLASSLESCRNCETRPLA